MMWPDILVGRRRTHWIAAMAGADVVLSLRQVLPGLRCRLLAARDHDELDQCLSIIAPSIILMEFPPSARDPVGDLEDIRHRSPGSRFIVVIDNANSELASRLGGQPGCRTLVKPLDARRTRRTLETTLAACLPYPG